MTCFQHLSSTANLLAANLTSEIPNASYLWEREEWNIVAAELNEMLAEYPDNRFMNLDFSSFWKLIYRQKIFNNQDLFSLIEKIMNVCNDRDEEEKLPEKQYFDYRTARFVGAAISLICSKEVLNLPEILTKFNTARSIHKKGLFFFIVYFLGNKKEMVELLRTVLLSDCQGYANNFLTELSPKFDGCFSNQEKYAVINSLSTQISDSVLQFHSLGKNLLTFFEMFDFVPRWEELNPRIQEVLKFTQNGIGRLPDGRIINFLNHQYLDYISPRHMFQSTALAAGMYFAGGGQLKDLNWNEEQISLFLLDSHQYKKVWQNADFLAGIKNLKKQLFEPAEQERLFLLQQKLLEKVTTLPALVAKDFLLEAPNFETSVRQLIAENGLPYNIYGQLRFNSIKYLISSSPEEKLKIKLVLDSYFTNSQKKRQLDERSNDELGRDFYFDYCVTFPELAQCFLDCWQNSKVELPCFSIIFPLAVKTNLPGFLELAKKAKLKKDVDIGYFYLQAKDSAAASELFFERLCSPRKPFTAENKKELFERSLNNYQYFFWKRPKNKFGELLLQYFFQNKKIKLANISHGFEYLLTSIAEPAQKKDFLQKNKGEKFDGWFITLLANLRQKTFYSE